MWKVLRFGRYDGNTLPQVLWKDPDWFFWAVQEKIFSGLHLDEARDLNQKARNIKIPNNQGGNLVAEYRTLRGTGTFGSLEIVELSRPWHNGADRLRVIDLSYPRHLAGYDKGGCTRMIREVKRILWPNRTVRITKRCAENFFDDEDRFQLP